MNEGTPTPETDFALHGVWYRGDHGSAIAELCRRLERERDGLQEKLNQTKPMNTQQLIHNVRQWGESKGITGPNGKGTLLGQLSKTQEELTETRDAAVRMMDNKPLSIARNNSRAELEDGIGDCAVTLILAAEMAGLRFEDCLAAAYQEIANRTGKMVDGQFVKDA
jgi:NTP pyrophosphatase (non-canonical NTP hydrolase)